MAEKNRPYEPPDRGTPAQSSDEIAIRAHQYWEERGRQHGHDVEDWLRAEQEIKQRRSS
jgi:hypothetical protein